jgi:hypothetical protein
MDSRRSQYRPNLRFYPKENRNLAAGVSIKDIGTLERSELTRMWGLHPVLQWYCTKYRRNRQGVKTLK